MDPQSYGIYIVDRRYISLESSVQQLAQYMYDFTKLNRRQRIIQRNRTERLSDMLDWRNLGIVSRHLNYIFNIFFFLILNDFFFQYYRQARIRALQKVYTDYVDESEIQVTRSFKYPRPISEPPSPSSSSVYRYTIIIL